MKITEVPRVGLIWAQSLNGIIGRNNEIPSEFPSDLAYFKEVTMGSTVVMGRNTWESLPRRPLPGRVNVVLSSHELDVPEDVSVIQNLENFDFQTESVFFIGGTSVYELGLKYANEIHVTYHCVTISGDVKAPDISFIEKRADAPLLFEPRKWLKWLPKTKQCVDVLKGLKDSALENPGSQKEWMVQGHVCFSNGAVSSIRKIYCQRP